MRMSDVSSLLQNYAKQLEPVLEADTAGQTEGSLPTSAENYIVCDLRCGPATVIVSVLHCALRSMHTRFPATAWVLQALDSPETNILEEECPVEFEATVTNPVQATVMHMVRKSM